MIRSSKKRVIGLARDAFLILEDKDKDAGHLILRDWVMISQIKEVKTTLKNKTIELTVDDGRKNPKIYMGNSQELESILNFLDPIQMAERRILAGHSPHKTAL